MIEVKSPKTNTYAEGLIQRTSFMLDKTALKSANKEDNSDQQKKKK